MFSRASKLYIGPYALVSKKKTVDSFDLIDKVNEALSVHSFKRTKWERDAGSSEYVEAWYPNEDRDPPREFGFEGELVGYIELRGALEAKEMEWFWKAYEKEIAVITKAHKEVVLTWGLFAYNI